MIDEIHVKDIALIREATLKPCAGLTVLTGETGAGKTALLSAIKLLIGERADSATVREGSQEAVVEGLIFCGAHDADGISISRRLSSDGRSRIKVNGSISSVKELSDVVQPLVDLCGQHEQQRLLNTATHVDMLDVWASDVIAKPLEEYQVALKRAQEAALELGRIEALLGAQTSKIEDAKFIFEQIDAVDPQPGEFEELELYLSRVEHAESLASCAQDAQSALSDENGSLDTLNAAIAELSRMGQIDEKLSEFADSLSNAAITIEDVAAELRRYRDSVDYDPDELNAARERYSAFKGLLRQWGPTMNEVFVARDKAAELLSVVNDSDEQMRCAKQKVEEAEQALKVSAKELTKHRNAAAPRFCKEIVAQMARLEMGNAELVWSSKDLPREQWTAQGPASCEFLYRSGSGLTPRPLRRIASGGELSRVLLACKVVLGAKDLVETLVFDEVDAGVGGSTALSLGVVLSDLAKTHQVIVVTHLAQVAVQGNVHYVVQRSNEALPETKLIEVDGQDRVEEIARMLSGTVNEESLAHAKRMLDEACQETSK